MMIVRQELNLHEATGAPILPRAVEPTPGSADFRLVADQSSSAVMHRLLAHGVEMECSPVDRHGARGPMRSIGLRDPDGNLGEIAEYLDNRLLPGGNVAASG